MAKILITGGSGLVGQELTTILISEGHEIHYLSTRKNYTKEGISVHHWDTRKMTIDKSAIANMDYIVHLAGAGVADERWTDERKKVIYESRIKSTQLLYDAVSKYNPNLKAFIASSAIGIYPSNTGKVIEEDFPAGTDFLAGVCVDWEAEILKFEDLGVRTAILRTGIVLANESGAFYEMANTLPAFVGALGGGSQIYSWIHIQDMARMYAYAILNENIRGAYNAVGPNPVSQKAIAKEMVKGKLAIVVPVPKLSLKILLGEMANMIVRGHHCSSKKIQDDGFTFKYPKIKDAVEDLLK